MSERWFWLSSLGGFAALVLIAIEAAKPQAEREVTIIIVLLLLSILFIGAGLWGAAKEEHTGRIRRRRRR